MRKGADRVLVYFGGFLIGMVLVSFLISRKAARDEAKEDPWLEHNAAMVQAGADPLPETTPEPIRDGLIIDFGLLPSEVDATERVWLLNFDQSYPYVRVVESLEDGTLEFMAADQVLVTLSQETDVTELKPILDELGLRLRMFNRKGSVAVLGVLHTGISAVPDTLEALKPWARLYEKAEPDLILFRDR